MAAGGEQVLDLCDQLGLSYVLGLSRYARLHKQVRALEASTAARYAHNSGHKVRRLKTFSYPAGSWSKPRRVVAHVEVSSRGRDTRYIVTNLDGGRDKHLYEKISQAKNHIKGWNTNLASDRTSCANQMRLMLHGCSYWIWWTLRAACPKRSQCRHAQFDTPRLHLVKLVATIVEKKTRSIMTLHALRPRQSLIRQLFDALAPPTPVSANKPTRRHRNTNRQSPKQSKTARCQNQAPDQPRDAGTTKAANNAARTKTGLA